MKKVGFKKYNMYEQQKNEFIYITEEDININDYIKRSECEIKLSLSYTNLESVIKERKIQKYIYKQFAYIQKHDFNNIIYDQNEFFSKHMPLKEGYEHISRRGMNKIERIDIPIYARSENFKNQSKCVRKSDIEKIKKEGINVKKPNLKNEELSKDDFYTIDETLNTLGVTRSVLIKLLREENITKVVYNGRSVYKKREIDKLKIKQIEEIDKYITYEDAKKKFTRTIIDRVEKHCIPQYLRIGKFQRLQTMYSISELELEKEQFNEQYKMYNEQDDNPVNLFKKRLESYTNIDFQKFKEKCPYTASQWSKYVEQKLEKSEASPKILDQNTREYVFFTEELINLCKYEGEDIKELYLISTNKIIDYLSNIQAETYRKKILSFLNELHYQIKQELRNQEVSIKKIYNIIQINKKFEKKYEKKVLLEAEIYSTKEFLTILDYCIDINKHLNRSLEEIIEYDNPSYVSTWLYSLIHLNNAWRHGDASSFKCIDIDDLLHRFNINNVEWFLENKLELEQSRLIVSRVINRGLLISKTQINGHFFCSDDVAPAVATAIVIMTHYHKSKQLVVINNSDEDTLMAFKKIRGVGLTKNNEPTKSMIDSFYKDISIHNFKFKSKKMNATLLTYIYSLKSKYDKTRDSIELSRVLRGHKVLSSTLHYININKNDINIISRQVFERGEFGYIYSAISKKLDINKEYKSFEDTTHHIKEIKKEFETITGIELITSQLNSYEKEQREVLKRLESMSFKERLKLSNKINTYSMPSKKEYVHCVIGVSNCKKNKECENCGYSIVTLFALGSIGVELYSYIDEYYKEELAGERIRISSKIVHHVNIISKAIESYGKGLVYSYLGTNSDEFRDMYTSIDKPPKLYEKTKLY